MQKFNFDPHIVLSHSFAASKPHAETFERVLPYIGEFFSTNLHPNIIAENPDIANKISGYNGHITLRVLPGGEYFYVYILDDSDLEYRVKSIHGPYTSR